MVPIRLVAAFVCIALLAACSRASPGPLRPDFLGHITHQHYADLLTAGLGLAGLESPVPPPFADRLHPSASELRRNAIYANYRAALDPNPLSGFGRLYGPSRAISGDEYLAYSDDGSGRRNVSLMVQVPDAFDVERPCIIAAASTGSAGIYGAIAHAGEWGLAHACAVAYTDKGTGTGLYLFDDDTVNLQDGRRASRSAAGKEAIFAPLGQGRLAPHRLAFKHAHSQQNPEQDWGQSVLQAIEFAFYVLNQRQGARFTPANTIVIATGSSNGGGAALRAAEQDGAAWIDGVVAVQPQIQLEGVPGPLDYSSFAALYQPCLAGAVLRCEALVLRGQLSGVNVALQQLDALRRLHAYGWLPESDALQAVHALPSIAVAVTFANAYARASVFERLCSFGFAATDAAAYPVAYPAAAAASSFATESGILGKLIYEAAVGGARGYRLAVSPGSGLADQALDGFLCLRALLPSPRVAASLAQVRATGNLQGKPTLIVHGQRDAMVPVRLSSRAYVALNQTVEGAASRLHYLEVMNANHFDNLVSVFPQILVPLQVYHLRALDAMFAHLQLGKALPPSQVVPTLPRPNGLLPLTEVNVPPWRP